MNDCLEFVLNSFPELKITREIDAKTSMESLYLDWENIINEIVHDHVKFIDYFPKRMSIHSSHSILQKFYHSNLSKKELKEYLALEQKFLKAVLLLSSYSEHIIVSTFYPILKKNKNDIFLKQAIKRIMKKDNMKMLKTIKRTVFELNETEDGYDILACLVELALKDKMGLIIFMPDINTVIDVKDLFCFVYHKDGAWQETERICMTEGLYLRPVL